MSTRRTCDMTSGPQGVLAVPNIKHWGCEPRNAPDEDGETWDIYVDFYLSGLALPERKLVTVSNTLSTQLVRNGSPSGVDDMIKPALVSTPTGYTQAINGWRGAATKNARQRGLADALIATGVIHSSLSGTTS